MVDGKTYFAAAGHGSPGRALDPGVRPVTADPFGVENADAKHQIVYGLIRAHLHLNLERIARLKDMLSAPLVANQFDPDNFDLARSPAPLERPEHVWRLLRVL